MERDHKAYFGQKTEAFTILGRFEIQPGTVRFGFETWPSVKSFEVGDAPIGRLRQEFSPDAEALAASSEVIDAITLAALKILKVAGRKYTLENLYISTVDKVILIAATAPDGTGRINESRSGSTYDEIIAANQELVGQALQLAWSFAKTKDGYLAAKEEV